MLKFRKNVNDYTIIKRSKYWNSIWYKKAYLENCNVDPIEHFLLYGWKRGYKPSKEFDSIGYMQFYKDVGENNINPLLHYEKYGKFEGRYINNFEISVIKNSKYFDEDWYVKTYSVEGNASYHYLNIGWKKGYNPSQSFSTLGYLIFNKDVEKREINPLLHYEMYGKNEDPSRLYEEPISCLLTEKKLKFYKKVQDERIVKHYNNDEENLIVFLLPELSLLGGGVLSINTIAEVSARFYDIHKSTIILATLPSVNTYINFEKFESPFDIYRFEQIPKYFKNLKKVIIHIPELYVPRFIMKMTPDEMVWLKSLKDVQVNILNQNDSFMPRPREVGYLRLLVSNITMTIAHKQYCTKQQRTSYNMPVHFLSTSNLVEYFYRPFEEKEDLLVYSPDDHPYKERILKKIKKELPDLKLLEIKDMSYLQYRKVISKAKWMITFGEGLDGYFAESIRSGCISFAVYNNIFFDHAYDGVENIYDSYPLMYENIVNDLLRLNDEKKFTKLNDSLRKIDRIEYDDSKYVENIRNFYKKEYTYKLDGIIRERVKLLERKPLVSIVMATFNGERYIKEQLMSLKKLTYPNLEVIISDDGSTDNTVKIIKSFAKKMPLKFVINEKKHGLNGNFENALSYAKGEFIALCDQDDIWEPNKIQTLLNYIDDFDIVHASVKVIDSEGKRHPFEYMHDAYEMDRSKQYRFMDFVHEGPMLGCTSLIRRDLIEKALPIPQGIIYHDSWLAQYAIKRGKGICFIDKPVIKYRQHLSNTAKSTFEKDDWNIKQIAYNKCRLTLFADCLTKQEQIALYEDLNWTILLESFKKYAPQYLDLYFNENYHSFSNEFMENLAKMLKEGEYESSNGTV